MSTLFFTNIPHNCSDREFQEWMESVGIQPRAVRLVRDLVAGVSPAFGYADLKDSARVGAAIEKLDGRRMQNNVVHVREASAAAPYRRAKTA